MIVSTVNLPQALEHLDYEGEWGLDTETTGLKESDRIFSLIMSNPDVNLYFNFQEYPLGDPLEFLDKEYILKEVYARVLSKKQNVVYIQNAKFDWRMLLREGYDIDTTVICTWAVERVLKNNYEGKGAYGLAMQALRRGMKKDDKVDEYITKHKLYTDVPVFGKKEPIREKHFDKVPFQIIAPYGEKDGDVVRKIGEDQKKRLFKIESERSPHVKSILPVLQNEIRLTRTLVKMEHHGILIDVPFVEKAIAYEDEKIRESKREFELLTAREFEDSRTLLKQVFDAAGERYPLTEKGNPSFSSSVLVDMTTPIADVVNRIRYHEKRLGTYYSSYMYYKDDGDILHPSAFQAGTTTGRMSYGNPNCQNIPKEDEPDDQALPYHIREAFIPRPGTFFYDIDYEQMEYRLMLDYAGEMKLIKRVLDGEDLHQATAEMVGITRKYAKTLNFAILYGAGDEKIALMLKIKPSEAQELKNIYFARLPKVENFIEDVKLYGRQRKFIFNWMGRRLHIASSKDAYKLPNHLIQGGCADIVKVAMNRIDDFLIEKKLKTRMLLQIHDELLFEAYPDEADIAPELQKIMESVYTPKNGMRMTTSLEHSTINWGYRNKKKGLYVPG